MSILKRDTKDSLTGLLDRQTFYERADRMAKRGAEGSVSIICLRVYNIKDYNIREGIAAGDDVLRVIARQLDRAFPDGFAAKYSVDTFLACSRATGIEEIVDSINAELPTYGESGGLILNAGYIVQRNAVDARGGVERARYACDAIRYDPALVCRAFDDELELRYEKRTYVLEHLEDAIAAGEICVHTQPIVRLITGHVCEVECLARWQSARFGTIRPDEFVGHLERHQLIHKLDAEVVRIACRQWREAADVGVSVPFGINLSRLDFELCDIFRVVTDAMATYDVPVDQVHIEITESALSHSKDLLALGIERFRKAGFYIYLDDFGTGYSSLRVLAGDTFDVVKLDMSLIRDVEVNERSRVIVADAVTMAKRLGMQTLCEGIETDEQLRFLRDVGCEKGQGYLFGPPMDHETTMARLKSEALDAEEPEIAAFLDEVGHVNLVDGTSASVQGVEAANFLGTVPFAVIEILGERILPLMENVAFRIFLAETGAKDFAALLDLASGSLGELHRKLRYTASKAKDVGSEQSLDFIANGCLCTLVLSHVSSVGERDAFLVRATNVSKYSRLGSLDVLERSMSFLYSIYKRIDLFDLEDDTVRNIYLNAPIYRMDDGEYDAHDLIESFTAVNVHPDDRERSKAHYDLDALRARMSAGDMHHDAYVVRVRSESGRYTPQVFTIIPMIVGGRRQFLSSLRDYAQYELEEAPSTYEETVPDGILLTGVLDVADRFIFWKDDQRRFLGANRAFLDFYGFESVDDILGKTDEDMGWHEENEPFRSDELKVLEGEYVRGAHGTCYARGVLHKIVANKRPLYANGKVIGLVGYFGDLGVRGEDER